MTNPTIDNVDVSCHFAWNFNGRREAEERRHEEVWQVETLMHSYNASSVFQKLNEILLSRSSFFSFYFLQREKSTTLDVLVWKCTYVCRNAASGWNQQNRVCWYEMRRVSRRQAIAEQKKWGKKREVAGSRPKAQWGASSLTSFSFYPLAELCEGAARRAWTPRALYRSHQLPVLLMAVDDVFISRTWNLVPKRPTERSIASFL